MTRVITIEREYGSGAADIARKLAERLGWRLLDHALSEEIARRLHCKCEVIDEHEERVDPLHYRLFRAFMRGSFEGALNAPRLGMVDSDCIRKVANEVVTAVAKTGNAVIVGRGSAYFLQTCADAFHVFLYAPLAAKVRRLRAEGRSEEEAIELAQTVDTDRAEYIQKYFGVEWPDRHLFHLMLNSEMGDEVVVQTILNAVAVFDKRAA